MDDNDYNVALARINNLMNAELGTTESDELDALVSMVEAYEAKRFPSGKEDCETALDYLQDQINQWVKRACSVYA